MSIWGCSACVSRFLHTTRLVDEVDGASIEREAFPGVKGVAGKHHRPTDAGLAQLSEQIDARDIGNTPVENDDVSSSGDIERIKQGGGIGEATDDKSAILQLTDNCFATIRAVFNVLDSVGVPPRQVR